jgi:hypothetical protein
MHERRQDYFQGRQANLINVRAPPLLFHGSTAQKIFSGNFQGTSAPLPMPTDPHDDVTDYASREGAVPLYMLCKGQLSLSLGNGQFGSSHNKNPSTDRSEILYN